jgi:hypothetical protein
MRPKVGIVSGPRWRKGIIDRKNQAPLKVYMTDGRHLQGQRWKNEERTFDFALLTFIRGNLNKR